MPRADADFGTVIDFLKNLAIMGGLLLVVLRERRDADMYRLASSMASRWQASAATGMAPRNTIQPAGARRPFTLSWPADL